MADPKDKLRAFYDAIKANPNVKGIPDDYAQFESALRDPQKSRQFYESIKSNPSIKGIPTDFDQFSNGLGLSPGKAAPVGLGAPTGEQEQPLQTSSEGGPMPSTGKGQSITMTGDFAPTDVVEEVTRIPGAPALKAEQEIRPKRKRLSEQELLLVDAEIPTEEPKQPVRPSFVQPKKTASEFLETKPAYIKAQQEEINAINQFFGKRSENTDFDKVAASMPEGAPKLGTIEPEFRLLEDDYIDYIKATNPELGEYRANELEALRKKEKEGTLSDAEAKAMMAIRNDAIEARNLAAEGKVWEIKSTSDIPVFQKKATEIAAKISGINQQIRDLDLNTDGDNPPIKVEQYNALVNQNNALIDELNVVREQTGFSEEKEAEYSKAIRSFVDTEAARAGGMRERFPWLATKEEERAKKSSARYEAAAEGGVGQAAKGFAEETIGTVGNLVTNILKAPKTIGDALGDNDYDTWDELYNRVKSLQEDRAATYGRPKAMALMGEPPKYEELPLSYRLSRLGGAGIGSILTFAGGGELTAALGMPELAGVVGTAFVTGQSDYYDEAIAAGMNPKEAAQTGTAINLILAPMEGIMSDVNFFKSSAGKSFVRSFAKAYKDSGGSFGTAIKQAWKALPESAGSYLKPMIQEGVVEEGGAQLASDIAKEIVNSSSSVKYEGVWDKNAYEESVLAGSIATGVLRAFNRPKGYSASPDQEAVLGAAVDNFDQIRDSVDDAESLSTIETATEIHKGLVASPEFNALPKPAQDHVLSELVRKKKLEESQKQSGVESKGVSDEIARIDAGVKEILENATQIREEYDSQNIEGVSGEIGERQEPVQAEPVETAGAEAVIETEPKPDEDKLDKEIEAVSALNDDEIYTFQYESEEEVPERMKPLMRVGSTTNAEVRKGLFGKKETISIKGKPVVIASGSEIKKAYGINEAVQATDITPDGDLRLTDTEGQKAGEGDIVQPSAELAAGEGALKDVESKFPIGTTIKWDVFGNEKMGDWTIAEHTTTRGGKPAIRLTRFIEQGVAKGGGKAGYTQEQIVSVEDLLGKPTESKPKEVERGNISESLTAIDPILEMKSGPEAVAARREYKEKYGKDTYEKAVKITRNFDKIVERLENEGKIKKKCP